MAFDNFDDLKFFLMSGIDDLGLSSRTANCFRNANLKYIAQIYAILDPELMESPEFHGLNYVHLPNFGPQALKEVASRLAAHSVPIGSLRLQHKDHLVPEKEAMYQYFLARYPYGNLDETALDFFLSPNDVSFDLERAEQLKQDHSFHSFCRLDLALFIVESHFKENLSGDFLCVIARQIAQDAQFVQAANTLQKLVDGFSKDYQFIKARNQSGEIEEAKPFWLTPSKDKFEYLCVKIMCSPGNDQNFISGFSGQKKSAAIREIAKVPEILSQIASIETLVWDKVYDKVKHLNFSTQTPPTPSGPCPV